MPGLAPLPAGLPGPASPGNSLSLCLGRSYDEKVDVFSFGIVLCEVSPWVGSSWLQAQWLLSTPHPPKAAGWKSAGLSSQGGSWELGCPQQFASGPSVTCTQAHLGGAQPQGHLGNCLLCAGQIIGRVNADPDYLPRTMDFGLNVRGFLDRYCPPNCPPSFFPITVRCCDLDPEKR